MLAHLEPHGLGIDGGMATGIVVGLLIVVPIVTHVAGVLEREIRRRGERD